MSRTILTKELFDSVREGCRGVPSARPKAVTTGLLRALLRLVDRNKLPNEESDDDQDDDDDIASETAPSPSALGS